MKSNNVGSGETGYSEQYDALVADAFGGSFLLPHQQLGVLALPTNPSNTQTLTLDINGTNVVFTFVTSIGATAGNVKIGANAAATAANLLALLENPQTTTANGVALSSANQQLSVFCGYALNGTSLTIYSQNNATYAPLTSFTASTTATSGTWTANTMALYVEPGSYYIGTTLVKYAGGNTPTFTAPSSHPRIDIVTLDSSGTLAVTTGTEASSPVAPSYPANKIVVCEVFHELSETIIRDWNDGTQGYISNDSRPELAPPYISAASQVATGLFIPWISSIAQGDVMYVNNTPAWTRLPAGSAGQVLTTQGASANPSWSNPPAGFHGAGTANGSNYSSTSASYADVDATNLKITLTGLTVGGFLYFRVYAHAFWAGSGTKTNGLALRDTSNSTIIAGLNVTNSETILDTQFIYKIQSATTVISLQLISDGTNAATVYNQNHFDTANQAAPWFVVTALS